MQANAGFPHKLSTILLSMSADYGKATQDKMAFEVEKADFFIRHKRLGEDKPVSDKMLEMMFIQEKGNKLIKCDLYLKGLSSLMSAVKTHLRNLGEESKNQY